MIAFWNDPLTVGNAFALMFGWALGKAAYAYAEYRQHKKHYKEWVTLLTPEQIEIMSRD